MSKNFGHDLIRVEQIPKGEPFVMLPRELICSKAWRERSINCIRLIDFLIVEHLNHAGKENGYLLATYDQLVKAGIGRRFVHPAITEAERLELIHVERGGRRGFASPANKFTLTFLIAKQLGHDGNYYYSKPTNNWKKLDKDEGAKK